MVWMRNVLMDRSYCTFWQGICDEHFHIGTINSSLVQLSVDSLQTPMQALHFAETTLSVIELYSYDRMAP